MWTLGVYYLTDEEYGHHLGRVDFFKDVTDKLNDETLRKITEKHLKQLLKELEKADNRE